MTRYQNVFLEFNQVHYVEADNSKTSTHFYLKI